MFESALNITEKYFDAFNKNSIKYYYTYIIILINFTVENILIITSSSHSYEMPIAMQSELIRTLLDKIHSKYC